MKRVSFYMIAGLVLIGAVLFWRYRSDINLLRNWLHIRPVDGEIQSASSGELVWQPLDETAQGFRIEMPGEPKRVVVQATNDAGAAEPISMMLVKPDSDRTYAVAWADKPPVARMNDLAADKTLDQARDGALYRTQSTLVSEIRSNPQGFPGRDVVAHNVGGGVLDTRFVYARPRLYMLIATSPSAEARHEEDVIRFFNSFAVDGNAPIPESLPATQ